MTMLMQQSNPQKIQQATLRNAETLHKICKHCKIRFKDSKNSNASFCCRGCEGAHQIVNDLGLEKFYAMAQNATLQPVASQRNDYSMYDSEDFQQAFVRSLNTSRFQREASLLIEGITCYACVWLIRQAMERQFTGEHTPIININQATGTASVTWEPSGIKLSDVVQFIESLGYQVMPHRGESFSSDHSALIRVGVGLFVMLNVMSFALAEYFAGTEGLEPGLQMFLRWISMGLTTLSLAWPGREFFTNTLRAVKTRAPTIDAPILVGLLAAFSWSVKNTLIGRGDVYYDSICAIVALVITGRYAQQTVLKRNQTRMAALLNPKDGWVLVKNNSQTNTSDHQWIPKRARDVKKGEILRILPGDMLPLKASCITNCAEISYEQLRGEAHWKTVQRGDEISAGTVNGNMPLEVLAVQNGAESYTDSLTRSIEKAIHEKGNYQRWSDKAAWFLFITVFFAAAAVFIAVGLTNAEEGLSRSVALLLVACPCTFAIGVPLVFGTAMTQALRDGILFKSQRSLEKLSGVKHFIFDKTGTLTEGTVNITSWTWANDIDAATRETILRHLREIDQHSGHHVAKSVALLAREMVNGEEVKPIHIEEHQGQGMSIAFENHLLTLGKPDFIKANNIQIPPHFPTQASVIVAWDGHPVISIDMDDRTRKESASLIHHLKSLSYKVEILSGDSKLRTQKIAKELSLTNDDINSQATPSSKLLYVKSKSALTPIAMVGNGLNDAGAMSEAQVSIAVANSSTTAISSADICLLSGDLSLVADAIVYATTTRRRILTVFAIALFYNILGLGLAAAGLVTPVVAAILMPISSLTITRVATAWSVKKIETASSGGY